MSRRIPLIDASSLAPGQATEVAAEGLVFAIFHVDGTWHVLDGICPHAGGPLGQGQLRGTVLTCPWHGWQFDVTTGHHCLNDRICQTRYAVEVVDGQVCVVLDD